MVWRNGVARWRGCRFCVEGLSSCVVLSPCLHRREGDKRQEPSTRPVGGAKVSMPKGRGRVVFDLEEKLGGGGPHDTTGTPNTTGPPTEIVCSTQGPKGACLPDCQSESIDSIGVESSQLIESESDFVAAYLPRGGMWKSWEGPSIAAGPPDSLIKIAVSVDMGRFERSGRRTPTPQRRKEGGVSRPWDLEIQGTQKILMALRLDFSDRSSNLSVGSPGLGWSVVVVGTPVGYA